MKVRDYYRLSDLHLLFSLNMPTLLYLQERRQLQISAYRERAKFVIGGWDKSGRGFRGYAAVNYSGLVCLSSTESRQLLKDGKVETVYLNLAERDRIEEVSTAYPFVTPTPNKHFFSWRDIDYKKLDWQQFPAQEYPCENPNMIGFLKDAFRVLSNTDRNYGPNPKPSIDSEMLEKYGTVLSSTPFTYYHNDICVTHSELVRLGIAEHTSAVPQIQIKSKPDKNETRINQLSELIKRMLLDKPSFKAKEMWRVLDAEAKKEFDERLYDIDSILVDVSATVLKWRSQYGNETELKSATFDSKVSKMRKELGINKK